MKKEFESVLVEFGKPGPIETEHYTTVAKATAEALADEIAVRFEGDVHHAAYNVLLEWFTGAWRPMKEASK